MSVWGRGGGGGGRRLIHGRSSLTLMTQKQSEEESGGGKVDGARGVGGRKMSRATHRRLLANHKGTIKLPQCIAPQVCKSAASFAAAAAAISAAPSHSHTPLEQQEAEPNDFLSGSSICTLDEVECRRGNNVEWREIHDVQSSPVKLSQL